MFMLDYLKSASLVLFSSALFSFNSFADVQFMDFDVPVTLSQKEAVREEYDKLPDNIKQRYESNGNFITFFDGTEPDYTQLLGIYVGNEGDGCIILTNTAYDGAGTLVHEMGHFVDDCAFTDIGSSAASLKYNGTTFNYAKGGVRSRSELEDFKAIWLAENNANTLVTSYESKDQCEYFAGSFAAYINMPDTLARLAPRTYAFIDNIVKQI